MKLGVYVHIPFCRQKCFYCDFPSYTQMESLYSDYAAALCQEISRQGGLLSDAVIDTIYIGGGTPTVLPVAILEQIITAIHKHFHVTGSCECTIEANPGTVNRVMIGQLRQFGCNRISFGVQSFSDAILKKIGRIHSAAEAVETVKMAQQSGLSNINIDLMYGLPGQSLELLRLSLVQAVTLEVPHISVYGLKVEEGTPFARLAENGELLLPAEEIEEQMYDETISVLTHAGYQRYEISNYARPGYECRHNSKYWQFQPYLGVGAAAHSFLYPRRFANGRAVADYITCIKSGRLSQNYSETIDTATAMAEFCFLALRMAKGIPVLQFNELFNSNFFQVYHHIIYKLKNQGLILVDTEHVSLTAQGMKYGNMVFSEFLL